MDPILRSRIATVLILATALTMPLPAGAVPIAGSRACADVGGLLVLRGKPIIGATLFLLEAGDKRAPVPINRVTKGQAGAAAIANSVTDNDPVPGTGNDPKKPDFNVGPILTPGNPPTVGSVGTRRVLATSALGASADAEADIAAATQPAAGGGILGATAFTSTECSANVKGLGKAVGVASAGTDPFVLDPLPAGLRAQLVVDLISNLDSDPTAAFGLFASESEGGFASASYDLRATSNIPGLATLFDLGLQADSKSNAVTVTFSSPLIAQPIVSSDFTTSPSEPGLFLLNPTKRMFSLTFPVPPGPLGSDDQGSFGLSLDIFQKRRGAGNSPRTLQPDASGFRDTRHHRLQTER